MSKPVEIAVKYRELFELGAKTQELGNSLLVELNQRRVRLFDLAPHKRIFLFILTRSVKTFRAIDLLCKHGYGQDVASLVRNLLENLITGSYIIRDTATADKMAKRFVDYKWVIFRRSLAEEEDVARREGEKVQEKFAERMRLVLRRVGDFKKDYGVNSDRALLTWSGKTLKDMARAVGLELRHDYEHTFRICSRFAHPSILGDHEYYIEDEKSLTFSSLPSDVGIEQMYSSALKFILQFFVLVTELYGLTPSAALNDVRTKAGNLFAEKGRAHAAVQKNQSSNIREVTIYFKI